MWCYARDGDSESARMSREAYKQRKGPGRFPPGGSATVAPEARHKERPSLAKRATLLLQLKRRESLLRRLLGQEPARLARPELRIEPAALEQGLMRAFLDDPPLIHDHEPIHGRDR